MGNGETEILVKLSVANQGTMLGLGLRATAVLSEHIRKLMISELSHPQERRQNLTH